MGIVKYQGVPGPFVHNWPPPPYPPGTYPPGSNDNLLINGYWYGPSNAGATIYINAEIVANDVYFPPVYGVTGDEGVTYTIRPGMTSDGYSYDFGGFYGATLEPTDWPVEAMGVSMVFEGVTGHNIGSRWTSHMDFGQIVDGAASVNSDMISTVAMSASVIMGDGSAITGILPLSGGVMSGDIDATGHTMTAGYFVGNGQGVTGVVGKVSWSDVPGSTGATGSTGDLAFDDGHIYVCVAENYWLRGNISEWP